MNLPNKLTVLRIFLTPIFLLVFFLPVWTGSFGRISIILLWILLIVIEVSDVMDGHIARKTSQVTDLGKVMDPFADVMSRMTYFLCFVGIGLMPVWIFAVLIYRELAISFLRLHMYRKGIVVAASLWGKLKAVTYAVSGISGLLYVSMQRFDLFSRLPGVVEVLCGNFLLIFFILSAISSVASFLTYLVPILKKR
jgi:CDP-diacylglycerol--glycerol-3-phosphate 3-phosphatidyltransferase